jgi:hypothetical protein
VVKHFTMSPFVKRCKYQFATRALVLPGRSHHALIVPLDDGFVARGATLVALVHDHPLFEMFLF